MAMGPLGEMKDRLKYCFYDFFFCFSWADFKQVYLHASFTYNIEWLKSIFKKSMVTL